MSKDEPKDNTCLRDGIYTKYDVLWHYNNTLNQSPFFFGETRSPYIVEFLMVSQAHVYFFNFSMNLNHKQCSNTKYNSCSKPRSQEE
jgi:hypothetical protein